jgi:c-di-GMP-binding flagellar brake protein YcgR
VIPDDIALLLTKALPRIIYSHIQRASTFRIFLIVHLTYYLDAFVRGQDLGLKTIEI